MSFDSLPNISKHIQHQQKDTRVPTNMSDVMARSDLKTMVPQPRQYKKGPYTVEASGCKKVEGETIPRRHPLCRDELRLKPSEDVSTLYDIIKKSSQKFGNAKALGHRKVLKTHEEVKQIKKTVDGKETTQDKKWTYLELSEYHYMSFVEYEKLTLKVGSGFRALGMNKGDRVHIFAATRCVCLLPSLENEWRMMANDQVQPMVAINCTRYVAMSRNASIPLLRTNDSRQAPFPSPCPLSPPTTRSERRA